MSYRGDNQEYIYLQLNKMCKRKHEIFKKIISRTKSSYKAFAEIILHDEIVQPKNDTINVYGPYWIDGSSDHSFSDKSIKLYFKKSDN